jgi:pyruvate/2-oxoglutarate dehydrogenase complex dihydrolipoamide acyltransferase (E2) component
MLAITLRRFAVPVQRYGLRAMGSLPSHQVVGLPSLSPTMATGTIGKWNCKVGDKISPGDSLCDVETDKAVVSFDAQDDFFVASLLVAEGAEVKVGDPILVSVEDESSVGAFKDFKAPSSSAVAASPAPKSEPQVVADKRDVEAGERRPQELKSAPAPQPAAKQEPAKSQAEPSQHKPQSSSDAPQKKSQQPATSGKTGVSFHWGTGTANSPLMRKLSLDQQEYIKKYGHVGHNVRKVEQKQK